MAYWLLNNNFFDTQRPYQHFGLALEPRDEADTLLPLVLSRVGYQQRPWRSPSSDAGSTVTMGADQFKVNLDVQQFKPEEISVKVTGDGTAITIEGKHEEKRDEHGYVSRQFVRRYVLPKGHDASKVESKLSSDGVLTVTAPRMAVADAPRTVAITQTGEAFKATAAVTEKKKHHVEGEEKKEVEKEAAGEKKRQPEMEKEEVEMEDILMERLRNITPILIHGKKMMEGEKGDDDEKMMKGEKEDDDDEAEKCYLAVDAEEEEAAKEEEKTCDKKEDMKVEKKEEKKCDAEKCYPIVDAEEEATKEEEKTCDKKEDMKVEKKEEKKCDAEKCYPVVDAEEEAAKEEEKTCDKKEDMKVEKKEEKKCDKKEAVRVEKKEAMGVQKKEEKKEEKKCFRK